MGLGFAGILSIIVIILQTALRGLGKNYNDVEATYRLCLRVADS